MFFQYLSLGYMTKTLNQIIFFFAPPKSEYFVQQHWESEYFFRKKTITPPFKLNGRSLIRRQCVDELNYVQIKPKQHIAYCICAKHREMEFSECCLSFDGTIVINASFVKNLGMVFDRTLCMQKQASAITKSCQSNYPT